MVMPLSYPGHAKALVILALPLIGSHVAQVILHVTNTVMLGRYGIEELAAGVISTSTFLVLFLLGSGFAQAVMPLTASAVGGGDATQARRATRMGMWLSILYGVMILPVFWFSEALLLALGQSPEVAALGQDFMRIAGFGMIPALIVMVLKSFLAARGRAQVVLWVTIAGALLNGCLSYIFIFGNFGAPELGVQGAATSALSVQIMSMAILCLWVALHPEHKPYQLFARFWRPDWTALRRVFALGLPIGLTALMESGLFHAAALMMGWIGTVELAAHGIALEITALTFMIHVGLSNAATVRVGLAYGAKDARSLRDGAKVALLVSQGIGLFIIVTFVTLPEHLIGLFVDHANPRADQIIAYGSTLMLMAALFQVADAAQAQALGLLRGIQDTRVPMLIAAVCYWLIGIPASYVLAFKFDLGGVGLWSGLVLGLSLAALALLARFWSRAPKA